MTLLITRPRYDTPTHYLFHWAGLFVEEAKKKGVKIIDLERAKARKNKLHSYLAKQPVDIVILNGHGNPKTVVGQDNEPILSIGDGTDLLAGKSVFVRACDSATILGKEIMSEGGNGFIGYTQPFMFPIDRDCFSRPLEDKLAGPVLDCSNQVGTSLIKGKSAQEAQKDSLQKYAEAIDIYSSSETKNSFLLPILLWNMTSQVCY